MQATGWIDADMCAAFGSLIRYLEKEQVVVTLVNIRDNMREILLKNGFLHQEWRR